LPKQILLNNFLSDLPLMTIATDRVDRSALAQPQRWDLVEVRRSMILFGLVSSLFDLLTFGILLMAFRVGEQTFQCAWFLVSLLTELGVILVLRTRHPSLRSSPSPLLLGSTLTIAAATVTIPFVQPLLPILGFAPLSLGQFGTLLGVVAGYLVATEFTKALFYGRIAWTKRPMAL
jgi:Mg2+-importing ATPase